MITLFIYNNVTSNLETCNPSCYRQIIHRGIIFFSCKNKKKNVFSIFFPNVFLFSGKRELFSKLILDGYFIVIVEPRLGIKFRRIIKKRKISVKLNWIFNGVNILIQKFIAKTYSYTITKNWGLEWVRHVLTTK